MPSVKRRVGKNQDTSQSAKFKEAARELGCDEDPKAFERTFSKIVPPKRPKSKHEKQHVPRDGDGPKSN